MINVIMKMGFKVIKPDASSSARTGIFSTTRGEFETPVFMPIGTYGAVKSLSPKDLVTTGTSIILGNTYHLLIRPGLDVIRNAGGLHKFISWKRPILTDSGGFQIFSLAQLRNINDDGVIFKSVLDGEEYSMTPERSMEIQLELGSDIIMAFDECPAGDAPEKAVRKAVERTTKWASQCVKYLGKQETSNRIRSAFFPIVQGGIYPELRRQSVEELTGFIQNGVAVGGLAVGEDKPAMFETLSQMDELLPRHKARYLMGVGKPEDIVKAVARGMDMFDCVIPTRNARNGQLFTWKGKINIQNERYKTDNSTLDESCPCYCCQTFSRSYLRHLFKLNEILGLRMATLHNVTFYQSLMSTIRSEILKGSFKEWSRDFLSNQEISSND